MGRFDFASVWRRGACLAEAYARRRDLAPVLIWIGVDPRQASATSGFIVIFSSLAAFISHAALGNVNTELLFVSVPASILGGIAGAWLLAHKIKGPQIKSIIGGVLYLVAGKMILGLLW